MVPSPSLVPWSTLDSFRSTLHRFKERFDCGTRSGDEENPNHLFLTQCGRQTLVLWSVHLDQEFDEDVHLSSRSRSAGTCLWSSIGSSSFLRERIDRCPSLSWYLQTERPNKSVSSSLSAECTTSLVEKLTQLLSADDTRFGARPLRFVNDVDVLDGRYLFFTDSDWLYPRKHFMSVLLRSNPRGRLIRFDLETSKLRILDDQLSFPNGVQLAADKQSVLVCETTLARVIRHWIAGDSSSIGKSEVFIDNLPGLPDNIRLTSTGNYWIAFASVRHVDQPSLLDHLRNWPRLRALLAVSDDLSTSIEVFLHGHALI